MGQIKYKRILLKLSGEALADKSGHGIDFNLTRTVCEKIKICSDIGAEIAIVVGAGNFWRGRQGTSMDKARADHMGMLATMINCLALKDTFEQLGVDARVLSAIEMKQFAETYTKDSAAHHLSKGRIVIFGCGIGNPFFTTDTAAVLRAVEINADIALLAKNIDGVYTADPKKDKSAKKYDHISYEALLKNRLKVIDSTAAALCQDNELPILIFALGNGDNIINAVKGDNIGTVLDNVN